jgi:plastocyanin
MVTFVASLIGAAAVFARVTSAVPMGSYGSSPPSSGSGSYGNGYGSGDQSYSSSAAPPSYTMNADSSSYGNSYGSGDQSYSSSAAPPSYTMSSDSSNSYGSGSSSSSYSPSSYGSGSSSWNNGGYNSCVQQCVAQFGSPSSMYMPPSSTSNSGSGSSGSGMTHTVWVAPTQGVLRYVPFAVNASVGDTVKFIWGANNHTVTKSSELTPCNKTSDQLFASGEQNKSFVFTQAVNDTNPTFFYCGTPTHCEKGMFGVINPPNAFMQPGSASMMMPSLSSQYPSTQAAMSYTSNLTASQPSAASWGMNMDMSSMPAWSQQYAADNILYTQAVMAMNPDMMGSDGSLDFSKMGNNPLMLPIDIAAAANNAGNSSTSSYGSPASSSSAPGAASSPSTSPVSASSSNGAGAVSSPRVAVALVAVAAAFFAL